MEMLCCVRITENIGEKSIFLFTKLAEKNRYGRSVGRVFVAELDVNLEMVYQEE